MIQADQQGIRPANVDVFLGVDVKRQKTKQSLEQVSGQQAFWGVSQEVVRMDTT